MVIVAYRDQRMATATRMTAEQYYATTVEGDRMQLVDGRIVVNEPTVEHARIQLRLARRLGNWAAEGPARGEALLPTDVRLDAHNVFGPDLLWFSDAPVPLDARGYPARLPDLCVEIRSESTWRYDIGPKMRAYERAGLPERWLVDVSAETVIVYRRSTPKSPTFDIALELGRGETLTSPRPPGFALPLGRVFER